MSTTSVATRQLVFWKLATEEIECPQDALHHAEGLSCLNWRPEEVEHRMLVASNNILIISVASDCIKYL